MTRDGRRGSEIREGWQVILACAIGVSAGGPLFSYVFSLFMGPLEAEFGWSRSAISAAIFVMPLAAFALPLMGRLMDRHGARPVALASITCLAAGYALMAATGPNILGFYLAYLVTMALGAGSGPLAYTRAVTRRFVEARGMALALVLSGASVSAMLVPPVLAQVIAAQGWRMGFLMLAAIALLVALPAAAWGLRERGASRPQPADVVAVSPSAALRGSRFWILCAAIFLTAIPVIGVATHLVPMMSDRGVLKQTAALLVSVIGAAVLAGRLSAGWLIDRLWAPGVACAMVLLAACGALLLASSGADVRLGALAIFLIGLAQGAELDLLAFLTARYFGRAHYGALFGLVNIAFFAALPVGAVGFGISHDLLGDYAPALWASAACFVAAAVLFPALGRYPR
jgi:predicted MFS family arabinose efflux permease